MPPFREPATPIAAVTRAGVVGGGTMGMGIAQVFAMRSLSVTLVDSSPDALRRARSGIEASLARLGAKGVLGTDPDVVVSRVAFTERLESLAAADFIVEAVVEEETVKRRVFADLDRVARPGTILASNTSSISITRLGAATGRPELVIGMHFMNPVPVMELVEVVRGQSTSDAAHETTVSLARSLGKTPVTVSDYPGFVSNRVLLPMINEAIYALMEGVAARDDIDAVLRLGMKHPMGPLQLADLIGLDVCLGILEVLQRGLGDPKYRPCPLLRRMVDAGHLGRKSGRGFYEYAEG